MTDKLTGTLPLKTVHLLLEAIEDLESHGGVSTSTTVAYGFFSESVRCESGPLCVFKLNPASWRWLLKFAERHCPSATDDLRRILDPEAMVVLDRANRDIAERERSEGPVEGWASVVEPVRAVKPKPAKPAKPEFPRLF